MVNDNLLWYRSFHCTNCGATIEEDGQETPEDIREAILKHDGMWSLSFDSSTPKALTDKVIREVMGLSLSDVANMSKSKNDRIISGTKTEVEWLKDKLEKVGVKTKAKRGQGRWGPG